MEPNIYLQIAILCKNRSHITSVEHKNDKNTICDFCKSNVMQYYAYVINTNKFDICELCNVVCNYTYKNIKYCIVCWSEINQCDINMLTNKFINNNNRIPNIYEIDKNAKLIKSLSFPFVALFYEHGNSEDINKIKNIKLFFTDKINLQKIRNVGTNIFSKNNISKIKPSDGFVFFVTNQIDKINLMPEEYDIIAKTALAEINTHAINIS